MKQSLPQIIVTIAAIIIGIWLLGLALRVAGWLLNLLLPVAVVIIIIAIVMSWRRKQQGPIKISRDTSDTKKDPR